MSLNDDLQAMADALQPVTLEIDGLQIVAGWTGNPTPPCIDIYPAGASQTGAGFGVANKLVRWVVRARVATTDTAAATFTLLRLMDPDDSASVEAALAEADFVLGSDGAVSGFVQFTDDSSRDLLGVSWDGIGRFT